MTNADIVAHAFARLLAQMGFRVERTGTTLRARPDIRAKRAYHAGLDITADITEAAGGDEFVLEIRHLLPARVHDLIDPYELPDVLEDLQESLQALGIGEQLGTIIVRGGLQHHSELGMMVRDLAVQHGWIITPTDDEALQQLAATMAELEHQVAALQGWIDDWIRELPR